MRIDEIVIREDRVILDEGVKDTLKKIGLGALLSVSLASPAQALDNLTMEDLRKMGMSQEQAVEIIKIPSPKLKGEIVQRFEKVADDPSVTKQVEKIKSSQDNESNIDLEKVNKVMKKIVSDDPLVLSYDTSGKNLNIYLDGSRMEKGYKNFLQIQKKGYHQSPQDMEIKDALDYAGFNNDYKKSILKELPDIENITFVAK